MKTHELSVIAACFLLLSQEGDAASVRKVSCLNNPDLSHRYEAYTYVNTASSGLGQDYLVVRDIADDDGITILNQPILPSSGSSGSFNIFRSTSIKLKTDTSKQRCELEFSTSPGSAPTVQNKMILDLQ